MGKNNKLFLLMPNHRRNASKLSVSPKPTIDDRCDTNNAYLPKHVSLPKLSSESEIAFEGQTLLVFVVSMAAQYLNLYRTVFWLPQSHTTIFVNYYLIDLSVVFFCALFITRPLILHIVHSITPALPQFCRLFYLYVSSCLILCLCVWGQSRCSLDIYTNHGITGILCISYPIVIYMLMYCPNIIRAYESSKTGATPINWLSCVKSVILPTKFSSQQPTHLCSVSAGAVREEVDKFKTSFNDRLKFILFRSLLIAYYSSFVPLCFAQSQLYYDVSWTAQHVVIAWLSAFLMLTSHLYSPHFYDVLHKSSLHLGKWQKLETRNTLVPCNAWSDALLYGQGMVVKYSKEYFKSEAGTNCAEPGNQSHQRYYVSFYICFLSALNLFIIFFLRTIGDKIVFSNPIGGFGTLLGLLVVLVFVQMVLLMRALEWYKMISMALMIIVNAFTVFRLVRSFYILREVYKVEAQLQENNQQNMN